MCEKLVSFCPHLSKVFVIKKNVSTMCKHYRSLYIVTVLQIFPNIDAFKDALVYLVYLYIE